MCNISTHLKAWPICNIMLLNLKLCKEFEQHCYNKRQLQSFRSVLLMAKKKIMWNGWKLRLHLVWTLLSSVFVFVLFAEKLSMWKIRAFAFSMDVWCGLVLKKMLKRFSMGSICIGFRGCWWSLGIIIARMRLKFYVPFGSQWSISVDENGLWFYLRIICASIVLGSSCTK